MVHANLSIFILLKIGRVYLHNKVKMKFYTRFYCFNKKQTPTVEPLSKYSCAGAIFTNGTHILAGYQPNKKRPFISGIGGRMEPTETFIETAIREAIEEILDVKVVPRQLIYDVINGVKWKKTIQNDSYAIVVYTFEDLFNILKITSTYIKSSPIYKKIPDNLEELLFKRIPLKKSEISQLCLLPVVNHSDCSPFVDNNLLKDIIILIESKKL
jgi:hypothetical protein